MSPRNHFSSKYGPYFISDLPQTSAKKNEIKISFWTKLKNKLRKILLGFGLKD